MCATLRPLSGNLAKLGAHLMLEEAQGFCFLEFHLSELQRQMGAHPPELCSPPAAVGHPRGPRH